MAAEDTRLRRRPRHLSPYLAALAVGGALALAVGSADAGAPTTARITAKDPYSFDNGGGGTSVTVAQGGTVSFSYPKGSSIHDVKFDAQPTSCSGLPDVPAGPGWSGSCRFDSPGTYSFYCGQHYFMRGKVEVVDPNAPPSQLGPPSVKVARRQVGTVVRGRVTTPEGPSTIAVTAFAAKRAVAARAKRVKVGSVRKTSAGTGSTSFRLRVNRAARKAIHRRHRLSLTLRVAITPPSGYTTTKSMAVALREKP